MTTIGTIELIAKIDTSQYKKGAKDVDEANKKMTGSTSDTDKSIEKSSSSLSRSVGVMGKAVAASMAVAGAAVVSMVTMSVKQFADYEQLVGGVDTLFKKSSDTVQQYAANAFKTAGLSANEYMSTVTSFSASLLQGLNGDTAKAAKIADTAITDMADNANKMGTSMDMIQNAYQGFAKDNFTMLDNLKLGYGGTAGEMARLVNEAGVMNDGFKATAENVKDIPFDKLIEAIHVVQTDMGITGTTALEAAETVTGSYLSMLASWKNLLTGMADGEADFGTLIDQFIDSALTFGDNVIPVIEKALNGVVMLVAELLPKVITMIPSLLSKILPTIITATVELITQIIEVLPTLIPILVDATIQLLHGIIDAIPKILPALINGVISLFNGIVKIITAPGMLSKILIAGLQIFMGIVKALPQIIDALIQALLLLIASVVGFMTDPAVIKELIKASIILFGALVMAVPQILGSLIKAFGTLLSELWSRLQSNFQSFAANFGNSIGSAIKSGINGVLGWIERNVNGIIDNINSMLKVLDDVIPGDQSKMRLPRLRVPMLAEGGIVSSATLAVIGEGSEPEAVIPLSKLDKMLSNGGEGGGGDTFNITVNASANMIRNENDKRDFANMIMDSVNQQRRAKGMATI